MLEHIRERRILAYRKSYTVNQFVVRTAMSYFPFSKSCISGLVWVLFSTPVQMVWAGEDIDESKVVDPTGTVTIRNARGDLEIQGWERSEVRIEGEVDDLAKAVRFEVEGKITVIDVKLPTKNVNWGDGSDLNIRVPHTSGLQIDGVSVDVEVEDVAGAIVIRTVSGDVEVSEIADHTQIKTVSGDVRVNDGTGRLSVVTTSGDVDLEVDSSDVFVDTMAGDVDLELGSFEKLTAESVKGSLKLTGQLERAGSIHAKTVSADIELELIAPVNAQIQAMAVNGDISNDLTDDRPKRVHAAQTVLETISGDGSARITLNSINGAIEIE